MYEVKNIINDIHYYEMFYLGFKMYSEKEYKEKLEKDLKKLEKEKRNRKELKLLQE